MSLSKFTIAFVLYSIGLACLYWSLASIFPDRAILATNFRLVFVFVAGLTYIAYMTVFIGLKFGAITGIKAIITSIATKMLFSIAFLLIYSYKHTDAGLLLGLNFFSLYLLFTFFEIYCLLRNLRHQNK